MSSLVPLLSTVEIAEALVLQYLIGHMVETLTRRIVQGDSHAIARLGTCGKYAYKACQTRRERYVALATARFLYIASVHDAKASADQDEEDYESWRAYGELIREYNGDSD